MLKQPMIEKLLAMRLHGMAESLVTAEQDPVPRAEFLGTLGSVGRSTVESYGESGAFGRRLKNAKLRTNACVEDIDYRGARGLDKSVIPCARARVSLGWHARERVCASGPPGGQSFVACALAQKACRDGYSALYTRAQALFRDLAMARADGSLRSPLARLSRIDVLVIDDG